MHVGVSVCVCPVRDSSAVFIFMVCGELYMYVHVRVRACAAAALLMYACVDGVRAVNPRVCVC